MDTATRDVATPPQAAQPRPAHGVDTRAAVAPARRPASATNGYVNASGLVGALLMLIATVTLGLNLVVGTIACVLAYAVPIIVLELGVLKAHRRSSTGLDLRNPCDAIDWPRVSMKYLGFIATLAAIFAIHALIPFFSREALRPTLQAVAITAPVVLSLAVPYIVFVDRRMQRPYDGYWHTACLVLGRRREVDWAILREHALGWMIKGFFLPIMFSYLAGNTNDLAFIGFPTFEGGFLGFIKWMLKFTVFMELVIVCTGYFFTIRLLDSHIRTSNPFLAGWLVTLACYTPFARVVFGDLLVYRDGMTWLDWFGGHAVFASVWGLCIVVLMSTWLWATMIYGIRWSNLTRRGIVTGGPYRFTKHPDYLSKSLFWWFIYVPFLSLQGVGEALINCLMLLLVNGLYYARGRYEEKHLSEDPTYVAYALWIEQHGIFRGIGRLIPALRYRPPASQATPPAS